MSFFIVLYSGNIEIIIWIRKKRCSKISLLSITGKCSYKIISFIEKYGDALLKIDWRTTVHAFCLVLYQNLGNEIFGKTT